MTSSSSSNFFLITSGTGTGTSTTTLSDILLLISISLISFCFLLHPTNAAVTTSTNATETDLLALLSFKSLISSDPFSILFSWNASLHHCQWPGISCGRRHPDRVTGLSLKSIQLAGQISPSLANLTFLQNLNLYDNGLSGNIPEEFSRLSRLQYLNLDYNSLQGTIPSALGNNCSNLEVFTVAHNNIEGNLPSTLGRCQKLQLLGLEYNFFLSGGIPPGLGNLLQLSSLTMSNNNFTGTIPSALGNNCSNLELFDVANNNIGGNIPSTLGQCRKLQSLGLENNLLSGGIPPGLGNLLQLSSLNMSNNILTGTIPSALGNNRSNLEVFDVANNNIGGNIPSTLGQCRKLQLLGLENNLLSGGIPLGLGNLLQLRSLTMSNNNLTGTIPPTLGNLTNLIRLDLYTNSFTGSIPDSLGQLNSLWYFQINDNQISGEIPSFFGNMQSLNLLDISNNKLIGEIPREIMNIHHFFQVLRLSQNHLNGSIPSEIGKLNNIVRIDLSYNDLSGQVPSTIEGCQALRILQLEGNSLNGPIPSSMSNLKWLQELDLSNNSFSGKIPSFVSAMKLEHLNISFNDFQGELPKEGVFKNVIAVDVRGNPKLCGGLPDNHMPKCISHSKSIKIILVCIGGGLLCISITIWLIASCYWRRISQKDPQGIMTMTEYKKVSYNDLLRATNNFSVENLIGSGAFGVVYKASISLGGANTVAVKVLNLEQRGAIRSFLSECEAVRNVKHRNLIKILTVCSSIDHQGNDFKALIFEYMPNGSLETWLHPNAHRDRPSEGLTLLQRVKIAIDIAKALDYLHDHRPVPLIHCDLKPSNVLLDDDLTAHVGDFGLARFLVRSDTVPGQSITSTGGIKGSIGYIPPEYGMGGQASTQGDVYSYGILLLEIFTGICPTDERFGDGMSLHKHVETAYPARVIDIIDIKLFLSEHGSENTFVPENSKECLVSVIRCGLLCSKELSKERIAMSDVVKELNSALNKLLE